jgi:plasmid stabilization system protein ParE
MPRQVNLRSRASSAIRDITRFISEHVSPKSAANWNARIEAAIASLATDANRWPQADDAAELGVDLREKLHGRRPHVYRILFTIDGDVVNVHRVRHAAQDRLSQDDL